MSVDTEGQLNAFASLALASLASLELVEPGIEFSIETNARGNSRLLINGGDMPLRHAARDEQAIRNLLNAEIRRQEGRIHFPFPRGKTDLLGV